MARESRGLGRGLQALLGAQMRPVPLAVTVAPAIVPVVAPVMAPVIAPVEAPPVAASLSLNSLPISAIAPGSAQPRRSIQQKPLKELAASIRVSGVIQPVIVRPLAGAAAGTPIYEIVAGERRLQAAKLAGLTEIPVVIRELSNQEALAVALIENIQREELSPAEEARSLQRLVGEFSLTHQQAADAVGRSRAAVSNLIRLLDLPVEVVALIDSKAISMGHARALLGLTDDGERVRLAAAVAEGGLSVRETETLVRKSLKGEGSTTTVKWPELLVVSELVRTKAVHVHLQQKPSGAGKLVVEFADGRSRDAIVEAIRRAVEAH